MKHTAEHVRKRTESMLATLKRKREAGWVFKRAYSRRAPWDIALTHIYRQYRGAANHRGLKFNLTREQVLGIIKKDCFYCGSAPWTRNVVLSHYPVEVTANGIDRIDSSKDYTVENCVPSCRTCNLMKNKSSLEEFKNHVKRIYKCLFS